MTCPPGTVIGNGPKEFPTIDLMNQMLDDCGNDLSKLGKKTMEELMCYHGIGKNRAIAIVAAYEFGKRSMSVETPLPQNSTIQLLLSSHRLQSLYG